MNRMNAYIFQSKASMYQAKGYREPKCDTIKFSLCKSKYILK